MKTGWDMRSGVILLGKKSKKSSIANIFNDKEPHPFGVGLFILDSAIYL
jgi:hypothetical protein